MKKNFLLIFLLVFLISFPINAQRPSKADKDKKENNKV